MPQRILLFQKEHEVLSQNKKEKGLYSCLKYNDSFLLFSQQT